MGTNYRESGDAIRAEKDGSGNWVLWNETDDSLTNPLLKIDEDTGETTWMSPPSGGVSNPMTEALDAGGYSINNLLGAEGNYAILGHIMQGKMSSPSYNSYGRLTQYDVTEAGVTITVLLAYNSEGDLTSEEIQDNGGSTILTRTYSYDSDRNLSGVT